MTTDTNNHECDAQGRDVGDGKFSPNHTAWIVPGETKWVGVKNANHDHDIFPVQNVARQVLTDACDIASDPDLLKRFKQFREDEFKAQAEHQNFLKVTADWIKSRGEDIVCAYMQYKHGSIYIELVTPGDEYNDRSAELNKALYELAGASCPNMDLIIDCVPEAFFEKPTRPYSEG